MAFLDVPTWAPGQAMPAPGDYAAQEQQQFDIQFSGAFTTMDFIESGRPSIEQAAGGNPSWTVGVDFARQLARSPYAPQVRALYRQAGLDLRSDLGTLTAGANIRADGPAVRWLAQTSVPRGRLQVPELDLHTISDQLVPVRRETTTGARVGRRCGQPAAAGLRRAPEPLQLRSRRAGRRRARRTAPRRERALERCRHAAEPSGDRDKPGARRRGVHRLPSAAAHRRRTAGSPEPLAMARRRQFSARASASPAHAHARPHPQTSS